MHLTLNGYHGNAVALGDASVVEALLARLPVAIAMTPISEPVVLNYAGKAWEDAGISGFVLIAESHISIHTFPARRLAWVDIFSCKGFELGDALKDVQKTFGFARIEALPLSRGLEYPHDAMLAQPLLDQERHDLEVGVGDD